MFRLIKSLVLGGVVACGAMCVSASQAEAGGWGGSYYGGYPSYGYSYSRYGSGYGNYGGLNLYNSGFGYQTFYTPGSNFRGAPAFSAYPHLHSHHCR
jgi:hypothetical protein